MAKVIVKGTIIKQTISAVLTAVAQITEFSTDGAENETADVTTIDTSGAGKEHLATGYTEGGSFSFGGFFDPALAGHKAITALLATPAPVVWNLISTAAGPITHAFTSAGIGFGMTGAMNDCLKFSANLKLTGLMTFP